MEGSGALGGHWRTPAQGHRDREMRVTSHLTPRTTQKERCNSADRRTLKFSDASVARQNHRKSG